MRTSDIVSEINSAIDGAAAAKAVEANAETRFRNTVAAQCTAMLGSEALPIEVVSDLLRQADVVAVETLPQLKTVNRRFYAERMQPKLKNIAITSEIEAVLLDQIGPMVAERIVEAMKQSIDKAREKAGKPKGFIDENAVTRSGLLAPGGVLEVTDAPITAKTHGGGFIRDTPPSRDAYDAQVRNTAGQKTYPANKTRKPK